MLLPSFAYHRPQDLPQAVALLAEHGESARLVAGGTDLLVKMKLGHLKPARVVDVSGLAELAIREREGGLLRLGASLTAAELAAGAGADIPAALAQGAGALGSPQVRNRATLGGNLASARPAADICVPLLALGASAVLVGPAGLRQVALPQFFQGPGKTALAGDEVLTHVTMPIWAGRVGGAYEKLGLRKALEISMVSVACQIALDQGDLIAQAGVALGAVAPTPLLSPGAVAALVGQPAGPEAIARAAAAAAADAKPIDDHRGSAEYRRAMVEVLTRRALHRALAMAQAA